MTTHVLLPAGLAIRIGFHHKSTLYSEAFLSDALIGRQGQNNEKNFFRARTLGMAATPIFAWPGMVWIYASKAPIAARI